MGALATTDFIPSDYNDVILRNFTEIGTFGPEANYVTMVEVIPGPILSAVRM